jgi:hypothetical protein
METKHYILSETSSAVGVVAAWKIVAGLFGLGIVATILGFLVAWPKTATEALVRVAATMLGSVFLGPLAAIGAYHQWPLLYSAGIEFAELLGAGDLSQLVGIGMVATPFICMAGLPFWWILGAVVLWFKKREGKDAGELIKDGKALLP